MIKLIKSIQIQCSPEQVFEFIKDPANAARWQDALVSARYVTNSPRGTGGVIHIVQKILGRQVVIYSEITDCHPPNTYAFKYKNGLPLAGCHTLVPKDGGTWFTITLEGSLEGPLRVVESLMHRQMEKQIDADLLRLKAVLEAEPK